MSDLENVEPIDVEQWLDSDGKIGPDAEGYMPPLDISEEHISAPLYDSGYEYEVIADPTDSSEDAWAVLLNDEKYKDVVVKYLKVEMDNSMRTMDFEYQVLYAPEGAELPDPDVFGAYLSDILMSIVTKYAADDAVIYEPIEDETTV